MARSEQGCISWLRGLLAKCGNDATQLQRVNGGKPLDDFELACLMKIPGVKNVDRVRPTGASTGGRVEGYRAPQSLRPTGSAPSDLGRPDGMSALHEAD